MGLLSTQASALADKRRRPKNIEKSKSRKVVDFSTFRLFGSRRNFSGLFDFSWLFGLFDFSGLVHFSRFFYTFRLFGLFGLIPLRTFLDFSTFRGFSGFSTFRGLCTFRDFSALFNFSGFSGSSPSALPTTHTHILNQCYHKSTATPNLRRPCRLRRVDLTCDSLNDVPGQPTYIRRRHLAIIFRPRALNPDLQEQCFRV